MDELKIELDTCSREIYTQCLSYGIGSLYDSLYMDSFKFEGGKIYSVVGEIGSGGWAISYLLSGKSPIKDERLIINGQKINKDEFVNCGWYAVEETPLKNGGVSTESVRSQIVEGLRTSKREMYEEEILRKFDLKDRRINYRPTYLGSAFINATIAIGYAYGKRIFCFPYLPRHYASAIGGRLVEFSCLLRNEGACVIIPVAEERTLRLLADEQIVLKNPKFNRKKVVDEYITSLRNNKYSRN